METAKQKDSQSGFMVSTSTTSSSNSSFDNWATAVRAQMLASLRKRGGRY